MTILRSVKLHTSFLRKTFLTLPAFQHPGITYTHIEIDGLLIMEKVNYE